MIYNEKGSVLFVSVHFLFSFDISIRESIFIFFNNCVWLSQLKVLKLQENKATMSFQSTTLTLRLGEFSYHLPSPTPTKPLVGLMKITCGNA